MSPSATFRTDASLVPHELPAPLARQLSRLRGGLIWWLAATGAAKLLFLAIGLIAVDFVIDRTFHLSSLGRVVVAVVAAGLVVAGAYRWWWRPWRNRPTDTALCAEVERRFPNDERVLVACVELVRSREWEQQGCSPAFAAALVQRAAEVAMRLDFSEILDRGARNRRVAVACAALALFAGILAACVPAGPLRTWFQRNVLLAAVDWPQSTYLAIEAARDGQLLLPRGGSATIRVRIDPRSDVVPSHLHADIRPSRARTGHALRRTDQHEFQLALRNVLDPFEFRIRGGDSRTDWVQVELVDPPRQRDLDLSIVLPAYLGGGARPLPNTQGPHAVPRGSRLIVSGRASRRLRTAWVRVGRFTSDLEVGDAGAFRGELPPSNLVSGRYTIELRDEHGFEAPQPATFVLELVPDQPPEVRVQWVGASRLVVRRAQLTLDATIRDDAGVESAWAAVVVRRPMAGAPQDEPSGAASQSEERTSRWPLPLSDSTSDKGSFVARQTIDLEPLELTAGSLVSLACFARDFDVISGPNEGRSPELVLRVVEDEELQADLLRREKEQRQQLEQVVDDEESLLAELRAAAPAEGDDWSSEARQPLVGPQRQSRALASSLEAAAQQLELLVIEARHNRLEASAAALSARLEKRVVPTLRALAQTTAATVTDQIDQARRESLGQDQARRHLSQAVAAQQSLVEKLRATVAELNRLENFQAAVNHLYEVRQMQQDVLQRTEVERLEQMRRAVEGRSAPPAESPRTNPSSADLQQRQQRVQRRWDDFETRCKSLAQALHAEEPERADRLAQTLTMAKERMMGARIAETAGLLGAGKLDAAEAMEKQLVDDLRQLLARLLTRDAQRDESRSVADQLRRLFSEMLGQQQQTTAETRDVSQRRAPDGTWRRAERLVLGRLSNAEKQLAERTREGEQLIEQVDGTAVLSTALAELRGGLQRLAEDLATTRVDADVTTRQREIEEVLAELAGVLRATAASPDDDQPPQADDDSSPQQPSVVTGSAELKLLRSVQARLLRQTQALESLRDTDRWGEPQEAELRDVIRRQEELEKLVERLMNR